jgi:hypothetical protein
MDALVDRFFEEDEAPPRVDVLSGLQEFWKMVDYVLVANSVVHHHVYRHELSSP